MAQMHANETTKIEVARDRLRVSKESAAGFNVIEVELTDHVIDWLTGELITIHYDRLAEGQAA